MALITCEPAMCSMPSIRPRRELMSPMMTPMYSSGTVTSTAITRLKQHWRSLACGFLERDRAGKLEGHFVRVHFVVAAVVKRYLHVHDRVAGQYAQLERALHALVDGLDVFLGHRTALDLVDEFVARAGGVGLDAQFAMPVVARAAGLANVLALGFSLLADGLAEGNLRLADIGLDLMLAPHAVDQNFQVQLAHAADNRLARIFVGPHLECGVLVSQPRQGNAHLLLIGLGLGLDGYRYHRLRECDGAERNLMMRRTERVTGLQFFQPHACADVAGQDLGHILALVGVHFYQAAN